MKIEFVGGARCVTGSCFIIKTDDFTVMVDRGMFQGKKVLRDRNYMKVIHSPGQIDALILTHAHIDHSGLIPKMVKEGFTKPIFATKATVDLCSIMLPDSAHIQEMDTEWINKKNKKLGIAPVEPLYTVKDAEASIQQFVPVNYNDMVDIVPGVKARYRDAGHILGSSFVEVWVEEKGKTTKIVFSGDVGSRDQAIIRNPEVAEDADILLIESTYGNRLHKSKADTYEEFKNIINESYNLNGNIVIPAFAIERTQEIIYTLGKLVKEGAIPKIPVYIDSPLAISATEIFRKNRECFDDEAKSILLNGESPLDFDGLYFTRTTEESKRLNKEAKGAIIISASGMCTAGRIKFHLQNNLYKPESSIIFVGFQAEGTLGRQLVDGAKRVRVYGEDVVVNAKIHTLGGFSGHADRNGLIEWMRSIKKKEGLRVFIVHGEEKASLSFADTVKVEFNVDAYVPHWGEIVDVDTMESTYSDYSGAGVSHDFEGALNVLQGKLHVLVEKYQKAKKDQRSYDIEKFEHDIRDLSEMIDHMSEDV